VRPRTQLRVRVRGGSGSFLRVITDRGRQAFRPVAVAGDTEHRFRLPAGASWVRAELFDPDLAEERGVVCEDAFGSETTYCRNLLLVTAMTSALYLRQNAPVRAGRVARGTARMSRMGRRCRRQPFTVAVRGRSIRRVGFRLDGRRLRGVRSRGRRHSIRIRPSRIRPGAHRISARVAFVRGSATRARTLRVRFSVCARGARRGERRAAPRFTG